MSFSGPQKDGKMRFSYFNYDNGIFLDEKKKRFVDFADMDTDTYKNYSDNFLFVNSFLTYSIVQTISVTELDSMIILLTPKLPIS